DSILLAAIHPLSLHDALPSFQRPVLARAEKAEPGFRRKQRAMGAALQRVAPQVEEPVRLPVQRGARMRAFVDIAEHGALPAHHETLEALPALAQGESLRLRLADRLEAGQP